MIWTFNGEKNSFCDFSYLLHCVTWSRYPYWCIPQIWRGTSSGLFEDGSSMFLRNTSIKICDVMSQKKAERSPYHIAQHQFHSFCWYEASNSSHSGLAVDKLTTRSLFNFTSFLIQVQKSIFIFLRRHTRWDCFQDLILRTCQVSNFSNNFLHQCQNRLSLSLSPLSPPPLSLSLSSSSLPFSSLKPSGYVPTALTVRPLNFTERVIMWFIWLSNYGFP